MRRNSAARSWQASAHVFAALGDEVRLRLLERLREQGALCIVQLADGSRISRQAITKHLHVLADAGLVKGTREGREIVWQLEPRALSEARQLLEVISREWDGTLDRLRTFVEA